MSGKISAIVVNSIHRVHKALLATIPPSHNVILFTLFNLGWLKKFVAWIEFVNWNACTEDISVTWVRMLARAVGVPFFFHFSSSFLCHSLFSYMECSDQKSCFAKVPKTVGLHLFPDPVGHFGAPWRPFQIFEVLEEGMIESKKLI